MEHEDKAGKARTVKKGDVHKIIIFFMGLEHREKTKKQIWIPDIRLRRIPE
jgi:hypothetical protein